MNRPSYGRSAEDPDGQRPARPSYGRPDDGGPAGSGSDVSLPDFGAPTGGAGGQGRAGSGYGGGYGWGVPTGGPFGGQPPTGGPFGGGSGAQGAPGAPGGGGAADRLGQPVCPRHPDRVSYVRCKRCDRPACPDCQRPAAVGTLCADCDRELSREQAASRPRNAMGGSASVRRPVVTYVIMALSIAAYLGQMAGSGIIEQWLMFAPFRALAMPWTFITSGFLHGGILHLMLNMWALWIVGQYLERTMGHARFAGVYLVSIIAGHTAVLLMTDPMSQGWISGTVGASGGVFGLFAAMFVVNRRMGSQTTQIAVLIGLNLVITFTVPGISWQGHLGGLIMGALLTAGMFALRPKVRPGTDRRAAARMSGLIHTGVILGGLVLCVLLVALRVMLLGG